MIAVDSSVAIAGFGDWHDLNERARSILDEGVAIPAHALLETYPSSRGFRRPTGPPLAWSTRCWRIALP